MNILTDDLPVSVVIDDKVYALNTDYRTGLTIMEAFEDQGLTDQEKALVMLELLYPEVPRNIERRSESTMVPQLWRTRDCQR